ncbi:uncharacterized protein K452DRAFT_302557 [Aplosporella prunicola CBS 121167]|uniref:J domain-containing protein n=1 Tax=Aplosporella prunicola CBS 121167 TaxID=1176127 RepID=A0A6A6AYK7_9PEZI|nr:uncharacterized protein K452DRAFT_302557 [Aplosporella prunicola CBS 121167]KAF2136696.1 hypothetical protein K452DRAFT_302557 [Aplosporella prunicola CBS 121167]
MAAAETQDPYALLEVAETATRAEIKQAYRRLALLHHPDRNQQSAASTQRFQQIAAAWEILSDRKKRFTYDATRRIPNSTMPSHARKHAEKSDARKSDARKPATQPAALQADRSLRQADAPLRWQRDMQAPRRRCSHAAGVAAPSCTPS